MEKMRPGGKGGPDHSDTIGSQEMLDEGALIRKMMAENGFRLSRPVEHVPSGAVVYDGLEELPNYKRQIDRAVATCRLFLEKGILISDDFGTKHLERRAAQET